MPNNMIQAQPIIIVGDNPNTAINDGGSMVINKNGTVTVLGRIPLGKIREALAEEGYTLGELVSSGAKGRVFSITTCPAPSVEAAAVATTDPVDSATISPEASNPTPEAEAPAPNADESVMNPTQTVPAGPVVSRNSVEAKVKLAFANYSVNNPSGQGGPVQLYMWDGNPEHSVTISEGCPYGFQSQLTSLLQGLGLTVTNP